MSNLVVLCQAPPHVAGSLFQTNTFAQLNKSSLEFKIKQPVVITLQKM